MSHATRIFAPDLVAYVEDYGPRRRAMLFAGDPRPFADRRPMAVCLHSDDWSATRAEELLAALSEMTVRKLRAQAGERSARYWAARSEWTRSVKNQEQPEPKSDALPAWGVCPVCREWAVVGQLHREKNDGVSGVCKGSLTSKNPKKQGRFDRLLLGVDGDEDATGPQARDEGIEENSHLRRYHLVYDG